MREYWANVYRDDAEVVVGIVHDSHEKCVEEMASGAVFRIHVKLKPEGAPKRYPHSETRKMWETDTEFMRLFS